LNDYISRNFLDIFKVLGDLDVMLISERQTNPNLRFRIIDDGGIQYRVVSITFETRTTFTREARDVEEYALFTAGVTKGALPSSDPATDRGFTLVQVPGKQEAKVFFEPLRMRNESK
jgi:hypothetical protein